MPLDSLVCIEMNFTVVRAAALGILLLGQLVSGASSRGSEGLYSVDSDVPPIVFPDLPDNYALSDIAARLGVTVGDMEKLMVGRRGPALDDFELRDIKTFGQLKEFIGMHTSPEFRASTIRYNWYKEHPD